MWRRDWERSSVPSNETEIRIESHSVHFSLRNLLNHLFVTMFWIFGNRLLVIHQDTICNSTQFTCIYRYFEPFVACLMVQCEWEISIWILLFWFIVTIKNVHSVMLKTDDGTAREGAAKRTHTHGKTVRNMQKGRKILRWSGYLLSIVMLPIAGSVCIYVCIELALYGNGSQILY